MRLAEFKGCGFAFRGGAHGEDEVGEVEGEELGGGLVTQAGVGAGYDDGFAGEICVGGGPEGFLAELVVVEDVWEEGYC